jgi:predicted permease
MRWVTRAVEAFNALFRKSEIEEGLDSEVEFHLEMEVEKNLRAGMSPAEARQAARREFGNVELVKDRVRDERGVRPLEDLLFDTRYAIRRLVKRPGFAAVVIPILALGIGANVAMFSVLHTALIRSLPYDDADHLVIARTTFDGRPNQFSSAWDYWDHRDDNSSFSHLAAVSGMPWGHTITGTERPIRAEGYVVSSEFFPMLRTVAHRGRLFTPDDAAEGAPAVLVISHGLWQREFGGSDEAIGSTLVFDGEPYTLIGVVPAGFEFLEDVDIWRPMRPDSDWIAQRDRHNWSIAGRLADDVSLQRAQSDVDIIAARLAAEYPESNTGKGLRLDRLQDVMVENYRQTLYLLMAAVSLILLIACGNVAGLVLARGSARRTELSMRVALGASGRRIVRQLLTESLVVSVIAGALGLVLARWLSPLFMQLMSARLPGVQGAQLSLAALAFAVGISVATALVFGVVPALRAAKRNLVEDLTTGGRATNTGGARFRSGLVVAQVALSVVLLVGAGLLMRSLTKLNAVDPGFDARNLLTAEIQLPNSRYAETEQRIEFYSRLVEGVRAIPGVVDIGLNSRLPMREGGGNLPVHAADDPPVDPSDVRTADLRIVYHGYFEAMRIPLVAGRTFDTRDQPETDRVLVISQTMADLYFPDGDAIGKLMVVDDSPPTPVAGVVGDVHGDALQAEPFQTMYAAYHHVPYLTMRIAVRTSGNAQAILPALQDLVLSMDRDIPVADVQLMSDVVAGSMRPERIRSATLASAAILALVLTALGLYGVLATYVAERKREIGIRMAFGASTRHLLNLIVGRAIRLAAIGIVVGVVGALGAARLIDDMLFGVESTDAGTFLLVTGFVAVVAVLAALLPGLRAVRIKPVGLLQVG